MKTCKDCNIKKNVDEFYPTQGECKECTKKRVRKNYKSNRRYYVEYDKKRQRQNFARIFSHRYSGIKARIEGRATREYQVRGKSICTIDEFLSWCNLNLKTFTKLHVQWEKSGWKNLLTPSVDRIKNDKGYTIDNMQWITKSNNSKKYKK